MKVAHDVFWHFSPLCHIDSVMSHRGAIKLVSDMVSRGTEIFYKMRKLSKHSTLFFGAVPLLSELALENATTKTCRPIFRSPKIIILVLGRLYVWLEG